MKTKTFIITTLVAVFSFATPVSAAEAPTPIVTPVANVSGAAGVIG
jgi:hypothetical protein